MAGFLSPRRYATRALLSLIKALSHQGGIHQSGLTKADFSHRAAPIKTLSFLTRPLLSSIKALFSLTKALSTKVLSPERCPHQSAVTKALTNALSPRRSPTRCHQRSHQGAATRSLSPPKHSSTKTLLSSVKALLSSIKTLLSFTKTLLLKYSHQRSY